MKFVSLIIFFLLLNWTWSLANSPRTLNQDVHLGIQQDLKSLITDYIQQNLPNSQNLRFEKFWTEKLKEDQVKAFFVYSFEDENATIGAAQVGIEGYAILNRQADAQGDTQIWSMDELSILNNKVEFKEALQLTPSQPGELDAPQEEE